LSYHSFGFYQVFQFKNIEIYEKSVMLTDLMDDCKKMTIDEQIEFLLRGCEEIYTKDELRERLIRSRESGKPLRVKLGLDPTAPDIHLGHTVVLRKLRCFQDMGHVAVVIIGDYTARVGDPSGANKTRPVLSEDQSKVNAETYFSQAGKILDTSPEKLEVRYNSEWLADLSFADVIKLTSQMTVARMLERDTFDLRYKSNMPIGIHEFLYPLMQGYDSVVITADVEIGGTDQTFNNLVGRQLQENASQPKQLVMTLPILVGLDGVEKMSKSKNNYIGITDKPNDMFGKIMSIPDELMPNYFTLLTDTPKDQIAVLTDSEKTHPREAKVLLGKTIVAEFYDSTAADGAAAEFDRVFAQKDIPTDMPEICVSAGALNIVELITTAGFAKSKGEAKRLIGQNAVSIDDVKITDPDAMLELTDGAILRVGKRRFGKIKPE
jgi:tyrosyl-tRNA synthetase